MRSILKFVLKILTKRTLRRYQPIVIGITGSVGKTTTKEAIFAVLNKNFFVWKNAENFNNEIGVPLAVLGIIPQRHKKLHLIGELLRAVWHAYVTRRPWYPRYLVLELAADHPGDIAYLTNMTQPQIGVVTAIGEVPVHVEHYGSPEDVAREKAHLLETAPRLAVLNADDPIVLGLKRNPKASVLTFGFSKHADYRASDISFFLDHDVVGGLSFRINKGESFIPVRLGGIIATHQIYGVLAAFAVAGHLGMNMLEIIDALEAMEHPKGRMTLLHGPRNTTIIDDTYNASPLSMRAALDTLKQFPGKRKVAILGKMAELGKYTEQEHRAADEHAKKCADIVIWCESSDELLTNIQDLIQEGDTILVKGSRAAKMEKIVDALSYKL